jgi:hypothetical protein
MEKEATEEPYTDKSLKIMTRERAVVPWRPPVTPGPHCRRKFSTGKVKDVTKVATHDDVGGVDVYREEDLSRQLR